MSHDEKKLTRRAVEKPKEIVYHAYEQTELQVLINKVDDLTLSTPIFEPVNSLLNFLKFTGGKQCDATQS